MIATATVPALRIEPLHADIGARITGIDCARELHADKYRRRMRFMRFMRRMRFMRIMRVSNDVNTLQE